MRDIGRYRGCLIGGAVGDALGYAVEFMDIDSIRRRYGEKGITEYTLTDGCALISDDTQMTLYTANAILCCVTAQLLGEGTASQYLEYMSDSYCDWLTSQSAEQLGKGDVKCSWLNNVERMNKSREPGRACIYSIMNGAKGTINEPINDSKGCGGVMRVAPIGLFFEGDVLGIDYFGAQVAALTHGHELGYIPAAALVHIINLVSHNGEIRLKDAVTSSVEMTKELFGGYAFVNDFAEIMNKAILLSEAEISDAEAIKQLGEGWVAEETLAIAAYCALKYSNDFEKAIIAAVNHSGDSDSTGAVTGNILGAYLGEAAIPSKYTDVLELTDVITEIANDLFNVYNVAESGVDSKWLGKYKYHNIGADGQSKNDE